MKEYPMKVAKRGAFRREYSSITRSNTWARGRNDRYTSSTVTSQGIKYIINHSIMIYIVLKWCDLEA